MTIDPVVIDIRGEVALVIVRNPPVNALNQAMRQGLLDAADKLDAEPGVGAVVLIGDGASFIAGADIKEFDGPLLAPELPAVIARIEAAAKPWIAAMHGHALGGGLEVALGCHYRIAARDTRLGLPEVTLGIIPGAGGTLRLPRLIGFDKAARMITDGKPVTAAQALTDGLIDAMIEADLIEGAIAFARTITDQPRPPSLLARPLVIEADEASLRTREQEILARGRGARAPVEAFTRMRESAAEDPATALARERALFTRLRTGAEAVALRHLFFAERAATRPDGLAGVNTQDCSCAAVVGGGTMGAGIAFALLRAGMDVTLVERDEAALRAGLARIEGLLARGRMTEAAVARAHAKLRGVVETSDLGEVDLVIEAVFEDLALKRAVFAQLCQAVPANAILATNTSYLDPTAIFEGQIGPERMLGLHFFSPARIMKLLEIVPTPATAPEVTATAYALARRLRKIPVTAGIGEGFIGNRLLKIMRQQTERLLMAGSQPAEIDQAMRAFGMAMGPLEAQDLGGLDIAAAQRQTARARGQEAFAPLADALCAQGRLGQKTGGGWYDYQPGGRTPLPSPEVAALLAELGGARSALDGEEIARRIVFAMVDEAHTMLAEGIARQPVDVDLVMVHGYGFPRWRGGLLHFARTVGLARIVEALDAFAEQGLARLPGEALRQAAEQA